MRSVLQVEGSECALACLAMILDFYGRREGLAALRQSFSVSSSGTSLQELIAMAEAVDLSSRAVRCEIEDLGRLKLPCILHWNMDHYVVLKRVFRDKLHIVDPGSGERVVRLKEASDCFTGVALELTPTPSFQRKPRLERVAISDLWSRVSGWAPMMGQLLLLTGILQIATLVSPLSTQLVVDEVIGKGDRDILIAIIAGFSSIMVIQYIVDIIRQYVQLHAGQSLSIQLPANLLRHLLRLPASFFESRHMGDILSRFGSLTAVQSFMTTSALNIILDSLAFLPLLIVMFVFSYQLAIVVVIGAALPIVVRLLFFPRMRRYQDEGLAVSARAQSVFMETVRAARTIKLAGREAERHAVWHNAVVDQQNISFKQASFGIWGSKCLSLMQGVQGLAVLYIGAVSVMKGEMTLGSYFAFQTYAAMFSARANSIVDATFSFRMLGVHLERLSDIVHAEHERSKLSPVRMKVPLKGDILGVKIKMKYSTSDPWVLDGASFSIHRGQFVVFCGPSGGGKSTLMKLLVGLRDVSEGELLVDGVSLSKVDLQSYRSRIGVVMQDDNLLSGTISDNVSFFSSNVDIEEVHSACKLAQVHEDIMNMPMGYSSLIGEMGSSLSGGQRQRILLARALYRKPDIIFLDEGTANLDAESEQKVLECLRGIKATKIMVAHRDRVFEYADRIYEVRRGKTELKDAADLVRVVNE